MKHCAIDTRVGCYLKDLISEDTITVYRTTQYRVEFMCGRKALAEDVFLPLSLNHRFMSLIIGTPEGKCLRGGTSGAFLFCT